jgi:hypothetical protein
MPEFTIKSNEQGLFAGPAPSSGYHFINAQGFLTGDSSQASALKQINGLTSFSYSIQSNRVDVSELGRRELVDSIQIHPPTVEINFDYNVYDLRNEVRLGLNPNFPTGGNQLSYFDNNLEVFFFEGLTSESTSSVYSQSNWPYKDRDKRNLFFINGKKGEDLINMDESKLGDVSVLAFGDCYLSSYSTNLTVGSLVTSSISYLSDNVSFHTSGSGVSPAIEPTGYTRVNDNIFKIPKTLDETSNKSKIGYAVHNMNPSTPLMCSDLLVSIKATGYGNDPSDIRDIGYDFGTFNLQEVTFQTDFERREFIGMGYKIPIDRPIKYPMIVQATISALVADSTTGEMRNLFNNDYKYDINIKSRNRQVACSGEADPLVVLQYDLINCKIDSIDFANQVNQRATLGMTFSTDVADDVSGKGLFVSGKIIESGTVFSGFNF